MDSPAPGTPPAAGLEDPINRAILAVAEDTLTGFHRRPFAEIARRASLDEATVIARIRALLETGHIRRVRQTMATTNLADGGLVAWRLPDDRLDAAFDCLRATDPFTGHLVIRSAEPGTAGDRYRLWSTVKIPQGFSVERHVAHLAHELHTGGYAIMRALAVFKLGVGHVRRAGLQPGARTPDAPPHQIPRILALDDLEWGVVGALMRVLALEEIRHEPWTARAAACGLSLEEFCATAERLDRRGVIGRFATFLARDRRPDPADPADAIGQEGALMQWAIPPGLEIPAGHQLARHEILTHAYWRDSGPDFAGANLFAVAHGADRDALRRHKGAIDRHLAEEGLPVLHSGIHWGERSEVQPSELLPSAYIAWCHARGLQPDRMRVQPGASA